jgi:hypothetical protein
MCGHSPNFHIHLKQTFSEKELCGHSPNFHIHVPLSNLYILTIDMPILLQNIWTDPENIYKSHTDTGMWKLGLRPHNPRKGLHKLGFSLQCCTLAKVPLWENFKPYIMITLQRLQAECIYYLCESLLPELDNIEHEVAAEPLLVKVHLPSESLHLHLHKIIKTVRLQKISGSTKCLP